MGNHTHTSVRHEIVLDRNGLQIDGAFCPLVSGNFEYWRNTSIYWQKIIRLMKESGLNQIATFVCWDFHEVEFGRFDFEGRTHPSRNLAAFIDLCGDEGMQVLIRVGPNIDAEWPTRGPAPDVTPLERLHPTNLERTRQYIQALGKILVPRLATHGGPIALVSIDNEVYFPYSTSPECDGTPGTTQVDYSGELVTELHRKWIERRYEGTDELGKAWSRPGLSSGDVTEPDYRRASLTETLDSFEFITESVRDGLAHLRTMCRDVGIDVPIYTNMMGFTWYIDWRLIEQEVAESHGTNAHYGIGDWVGERQLVASWNTRLVRALCRYAWAPEYAGYEPDAKVVLNTNVFSAALGLRGASYYVFVERDDMFQAPINGVGKIRPSLAGYKSAIEVFNQLRPDHHLASVGLLWSVDHHRCFIASKFDDWRKLYFLRLENDQPKEFQSWWRVFGTLHDEDVDFDIAPIDQSYDDYDVLIYAGPDYVRRSELERLKAWVGSGHTLIVATSIPTRSIAPEGDDLTDLVSTLSQSPHVIRPWGSLTDAFEQSGIENAVHAEVPNVLTFAYEDNTLDAWTLFIVNTGEVPVRASVKLAETLMTRMRGRSAHDPVSLLDWEVQDASLWNETPMLLPNEARCVRIT